MFHGTEKIFSSRPPNVKIHMSFSVFSVYQKYGKNNKANLSDLIVATGLVILLKLDSNCQLFSTCDHEIWWVTLKNNMAPLLYYVKLWASFQIHRRILTGVTVRKCSIRVKIGDFLSRVILKFDGWHWKTIGHLFHTVLSFVHHFKAIGEFKLELQSGNAQFGSKLAIFCPVWLWNLTNDIEKQQGAVSIRKTVLPGMAIPMLKIRRPNGRLIFNMEIAIRR